ncbi:MAG: outer membrane protein assembly factor BamE [Alphaproteobacteria bacterium]|nr:outer membrane protein assembly factor BamE [Alphaproteobacteria bacterium]
MTKQNMKRKLILSAAAALLLTSACTPTISQRGNKLEDYQLQGVVAGVHTRTDVLRILGSPTTQAPFDENIWYYIGQETEKRGILDPEVTDERIVVVAFNDEGVVEQIEEVDSDRINIPLARSKTATHGNDLTVMQQLLGNLGRFNPQTSSGDLGSSSGDNR